MTTKELLDPAPTWDRRDISDYRNYQKNRTLIECIQDFEDIAYPADLNALEQLELDLIYLQRPFIFQGQIFYRIFKDFMFREKGYTCFKKYCQEVHGLKFWQVRKLIDASRIATFLISDEFMVIPKNKYQCEILMWLENTLVIDERYPSAYERISRVWQIVCETYQEHEITGKVIANVIRLEFPKFVPERIKRKVILTVETANLLQRAAVNEGVNQDALVRQLLNDRDHENNDINHDFECDYDHDEMVEETLLLDRFRKVCTVMGIKVNQVLDIVVSLLQEGNNLVEIFSTG